MSSSRTLKSIKILVTVMTVCITIGLAFVAYGLLINGTHFRESSALGRVHGKTEGSLCADRCVPFGTVTLQQAPGTRITAMVVASQCLLMKLEGGEQGERVIVVDLVSGRVLGTVTVESAHAP